MFSTSPQDQLCYVELAIDELQLAVASDLHRQYLSWNAVDIMVEIDLWHICISVL